MTRSLCSVLLVIAVICGPAAGAARAGEDDIVALFTLKGPMPEAPDPLGLEQLFGGKTATSMFDLLARLREARADEHVRAVVFDIDEAGLGFAQIQELRAQFEALRAAEKDVWIFTESLGTGGLVLASAAGRLVLLPTGDVVFHGLYAEGLYFKRMLDKIGVQADIIHCGSHKAAGEPFYLEKPSKEAEEQTNWLLDSIFRQVIEQVARSRRLSPERVRELVDVGRFSAREALEAKLVDKLMYREDFIRKLRRTYGQEAKYVSDYGRRKGPEIDFENPFAIFKLFGDMMKASRATDKPAVAVVFVEGAITSGESEPDLFSGRPANAGSATIRRAIAQAARDETVKALVLRVDSPGGSAIASDVICEATKQFKKSGRPFVVSMGNVAGSGGYYVSTLGDVIFAQPGSITGSIGVVGGKIVTKGVCDWAGITSHEYKRGRRSDLMNTNRPFTEEERATVTGWMTRIYADFKNRVLEGRKDRIKGELEPLAGGRVYTGAQALENGLIDRLGGFADAIRHAAGEADLGSDYEVRVFPKPRTIVDIFAEAFGGKKDEDDFVSSPGPALALRSGFGRLPEVAAGLRAVQSVDPAKARAMQDFLIQLELFTRESVLLIGPAPFTLAP
jgi:protease-4